MCLVVAWELDDGLWWSLRAVGGGGRRGRLDAGEGTGADAGQEGPRRCAGTLNPQPSRPCRLRIAEVPQVPMGQGLAVGPNDQVLDATRIGRAHLRVGL